MIKKNISNLIVGSNRIALEAIVRACRNSSVYVPLISTTCLQGEARNVARQLVDVIMRDPDDLTWPKHGVGLFQNQTAFENVQKLVREHQRYCLLLGGETTVILNGQIGKGGRCQEIAVSAALAMTEFNRKKSVLLLAAGSDGVDGPTDAAGGFAYNEMLVNIEDQERARLTLDQHDTYHFLNQFNGGENLLKIGHTNTNVMDILIVLVDRSVDS